MSKDNFDSSHFQGSDGNYITAKANSFAYKNLTAFGYKPKTEAKHKWDSALFRIPKKEFVKEEL